MGNITALRKEMAPPPAYPVFSMDDEAATLFPELAFEVHKAWRTMEFRLPASERKKIDREVGKHFRAMEQVLALLHGSHQSLYVKAMESYLTMKLKVLKGQIARVEILNTFVMM
jgi:hypothetical protein